MDYITTEQLIKEVVAMGYEISTGSVNDYHFVEIANNSNNIVIATVTQDQIMQLDTMYLGWDDLNDQDRSKLYNLLDRYARTPLDKREKQKKYRLRVDFDKIINLKYSNAMMLVLAQKLGGLNNKKCYFAVPGENEPKIKFTQAEIDEMGDLTKGFVKEEICEK